MDTKWKYYHDIDLYKMFAGSEWDNLDVDDRKSLLQEVENRAAAKRGTEARTLTFDDLEGGTLGYQKGDSIVINSNLVERGAYRVNVNNKEDGTVTSRDVKLPASNWHLLDTVFHEDTHGIQEDENRGQTVKSYIESESNYMLYRLGPDEREAFRNGQGKTLSVIDYVTEYGEINDPTMRIYVNSVKNDSEDALVEEAKILYNDPNIEEHIDTWANDVENNLEHSEEYAITHVLDRTLEEQRQRHYQEYMNQVSQTSTDYFNPVNDNESMESTENGYFNPVSENENTESADNDYFNPISETESDESESDDEDQGMGSEVLKLGRGGLRF